MRILAALALTLGLAATAANPDLTSIPQNVKDHPESYASLLDRFNTGDSTLTADEVAMVYFGAPAAGKTVPEADYSRINALRSERRYSEMMPLCAEALKSDPVSLTLLFRTFAGAYNNNDAATQASASTRVNQLCDAIFASGTGVTETDPFRVVAKADIEQFLNNYLRVDRILGMSAMGALTVAQVQLPGREEPAYLYFLPME